MLVKYATAIRIGTATTRRSCAVSPATPPIRLPGHARTRPRHRRPSSSAATSRPPRGTPTRDPNAGLNVVEGWNGVNDVIYFGKSGEFASNHRDQQELSLLCLHLLQRRLVFVNTIMIQDNPRRTRLGRAAHRGRPPA